MTRAELTPDRFSGLEIRPWLSNPQIRVASQVATAASQPTVYCVLCEKDGKGDDQRGVE